MATMACAVMSSKEEAMSRLEVAVHTQEAWEELLMHANVGNVEGQFLEGEQLVGGKRRAGELGGGGAVV